MAPYKKAESTWGPFPVSFQMFENQRGQKIQYFTKKDKLQKKSQKS